MGFFDDVDTEQTDYVKFDREGDRVTGVIRQIGKKQWDDGKVDPQLTIELPGGRTVTWTAGQTQAKNAVIAADREGRLALGVTIDAELTRIEKRNGGKTLKHFRIEIGGQAPQATATPLPQAASAPASTLAPTGTDAESPW